MPTLNRVGKDAVRNHHAEVPYRIVHCDQELSAGDPDAGNLLIQGDNLDALKALLPHYAGQVKCIYIDPPYNTGNKGRTYNDNVTSPEIEAWLGKVVGKEANNLSRHDKWLCMMYPRLKLLREFLGQDGAIIVSIDDNELGALLLLMDEILGQDNRIGVMVWQKGKKGDAKLVSSNHEYIVVYARNKTRLTDRNVKWRRRKQGVDEVLARYRDIRDHLYPDHEVIRSEMMKWYRSLNKDDPRKSHRHYNWSDDRGLYFAADFSGPDDGRDSRPRYAILHPETHKPCKIPATGWRWKEDRTRDALAMNPPRIHFGKTHYTIPCRKNYLSEIDKEPLQSVFYKDGRGATRQVDGILGKEAFQFPKDIGVLADMLNALTDEGDLILDGFAGSGSTGHAVFSLNAMCGTSRRFILVEMDRETAMNRTAKRLTRAVSGYDEEITPFRNIKGLGGGFRYCYLGVPFFNEFGDIDTTIITFSNLAAYIFLYETGVPLPFRVDGNSSFIGKYAEKAVYLLFAKGQEGKPCKTDGNVLTLDVLANLPVPSANLTAPSANLPAPLQSPPERFEGTRVVYAEASTVLSDRLKAENVVFRQIPYRIDKELTWYRS